MKKKKKKDLQRMTKIKSFIKNLNGINGLFRKNIETSKTLVAS